MACNGRSPSIARKVIKYFASQALPVASNMPEVSLTERESEVLRQLARGLTNEQIAEAMHISYETIKEHIQHIFRKIGVSDRTQAAVWAVRNNLG